MGSTSIYHHPDAGRIKVHKVGWERGAERLEKVLTPMSTPFGVPANPALIGRSVFTLWALIDPGTNATGVITSQGGQVYIR